MAVVRADWEEEEDLFVCRLPLVSSVVVSLRSDYTVVVIPSMKS